jgi:hypothetical protein
VGIMGILNQSWHEPFDFYGWQNEIELAPVDMEVYYEMIIWINKNIQNHRSNVFWMYTSRPTFRFRKAQDQVWFMLMWVS